MRKLRLRSVVWVEPDVCRVSLVDEAGIESLTTFQLTRSHRGPVVANSNPDVFRDFSGSASEVRAIVGAVIQFCLVAQGEWPSS